MGSVELWILRVKWIPDDEPLGNNEAQKSKRQKPSVKAKSKRQQSTQETKSLDLEVRILADQNSPTEHEFSEEPSPLLLGIHAPLKN